MELMDNMLSLIGLDESAFRFLHFLLQLLWYVQLWYVAAGDFRGLTEEMFLVLLSSRCFYICEVVSDTLQPAVWTRQLVLRPPMHIPGDRKCQSQHSLMGLLLVYLVPACGENVADFM